MSFISKLRNRIEAASLSSDIKEMLGTEVSTVLDRELKDIQSNFAGQLSRIETKVKKELEKSQKVEQFGIVKRQIRTALAKWLYMSGVKK